MGSREPTMIPTYAPTEIPTEVPFAQPVSASPSFTVTSAVIIPEEPFYGWIKQYGNSGCDEAGSTYIEHVLLDTCLVGSWYNKKYVCGKINKFPFSLLLLMVS
jgi:hypothetical protein